MCKGLIADRLRELQMGKSILRWRCCRASYGTICKELYNKKKPEHIGRDVHFDPMNKKRYVTDHVAWFIKQVNLDSSVWHFRV